MSEQRVGHRTAARQADAGRARHATEAAATEDGAREAAACPRCRAAVDPGGDLCERCGAWLLEDCCAFCGEAGVGDQAFCGRCGCPPGGVRCACGTFSRFDFCPGCGEATTRRARRDLAALADDVHVRRLLECLDAVQHLETAADPGPSAAPAADPRAAILDELTALRHGSRGAAATPGSADGSPARPAPEADVAFEDLAHAAAQAAATRAAVQAADAVWGEALARAREEAARALAEAQRRAFDSHQDARRFFGALRLHVVRRARVTRRMGWRCRAFGVVHAAPSGCCAPQSGGEWVFDVAEEEVVDELTLAGAVE